MFFKKRVYFCVDRIKADLFLKNINAMEGQERREENEARERDEIFSKSVRAGKRTYFFDVKSTRNEDYYLTITESKKRVSPDGKVYYEKHKIFLYKEDFEKFAEGLSEVVQFIRTTKGDSQYSNNEEKHHSENTTEPTQTDFSNVSFDDLEGKKEE